MEKVSVKVFQVFEFNSTGGCHSVSKVYPTWLGAKRVRNRIALEHFCLVGYGYRIMPVLSNCC